MPPSSPSPGVALVPFATSFLCTSILLCALLAMVGMRQPAVEPPARPVVSALKSVTQKLCDIEQAVKQSTEAVKSSPGELAKAITLGSAMPPLLFKDAELDDNGELSPCSNGIRLEDTHESALHQMVRTVASNCTISKGGEKLVVQVVGYSSEAPFHGAANTDSLNVQAANLRAFVAAEALRLMFDSSTLRDRVTLRHHGGGGGYHEIARPSLHDSTALDRRDTWLVERSVFVWLANPSVCWT